MMKKIVIITCHFTVIFFPYLPLICTHDTLHLLLTHFRTWDYPLKEQYSSILMSIERGTKTLVNASEGFRSVNEREDFAFIHDVLEIKYEMARNCNFTTVGDTIAEQPYAIGEDFFKSWKFTEF